MKRTIVLTLSFAGVLLLLALYLVYRQRAAQPGEQFRIRDTQKIRRISFRRDTARLELRRQDGTWRVNGRWQVRPRAMKVLQKVLATMEVRSPLSGELPQRVMEDTASIHTEVRVYGAFLLLKHFEVYLNEKIPGGNMMRLKGKKEWYIVRVPGEEINPAALFVTDPWYWRDLTLFRFLPGEVIAVEIKYGADKSNGFRAGRDTLTDRVSFVPADPSLRGYPVDTARVRKFLSYFQVLECDAWDRSLSAAQQDSILRQTPLYEVDVTARDDRHFRMRIYPLPARDTSAAPGGKDPDVARAWVEPQKEMVLIKYYRIDPFLFTADDLLLKLP